jgi:hypothetical protein
MWKRPARCSRRGRAKMPAAVIVAFPLGWGIVMSASKCAGSHRLAHALTPPRPATKRPTDASFALVNLDRRWE